MDNKDTLNRNLTNLKQDPKYNKEFASKNFKTLKYYTENYNDPSVNLNKLLTLQDEFADVSNKLHYSEVVADRQKTVLPPLPLLTSPSLIRGKQDTEIEDNLRGQMVRDKKSCNPFDEKIYNRHFAIFDSMPITYNSVKTPGVQMDHSFRGGIDTRENNFDYTNKQFQ